MTYKPEHKYYWLTEEKNQNIFSMTVVLKYLLLYVKRTTFKSREDFMTYKQAHKYHWFTEKKPLSNECLQNFHVIISKYSHISVDLNVLVIFSFTFYRKQPSIRII